MVGPPLMVGQKNEKINQLGRLLPEGLVVDTSLAGETGYHRQWRERYVAQGWPVRRSSGQQVSDHHAGDRRWRASEACRAPVSRRVRVLPLVAEEDVFALKGGTAIGAAG